MLLQMCRRTSLHRMLDVGTGDGDLWQFAPPHWVWHAIDISPVGVRRAVNRFPKVLGTAGLAESLPYPDAFFGAVIAADTIEHLFDIGQGLREIKRVLAEGGYFALSVPTPNSLPKWAYNRFIGQRPQPLLLGKLLYTILLRTILFGHPTFQPIDRDLSLSQWQHILTAEGFTIEETIAWPKPPLKAIVYLIGTRKAHSKHENKEEPHGIFQ